MNLRAYIYSIFSIFLLIGISNASSLENRVTSYFNGLADSLGTSVSSLLGENGINIYERVSLKIKGNKFNAHYLGTKAKKSGHLL